MRALKLGFYDNKRRREGDIFTLDRASEFSSKWMEYVDPKTPERITTGSEDLKRQHDETLAARSGAAPPSRETDVLGDED